MAVRLVVKRYFVKCPVCESSAVEYRYSNGDIEIVCYSDFCGNRTKWK